MVGSNTATFLQSNYKIDSKHKIYTRYQNLWATFVAKEGIDNEYNDMMLFKFFKEIMSKNSENTLLVIYSCINTSFIDRNVLNLKSLLWLKKFLKGMARKYIAKNLATFSPEEIHKVLLHLQNQNATNWTLCIVAIALS